MKNIMILEFYRRLTFFMILTVSFSLSGQKEILNIERDYYYDLSNMLENINNFNLAIKVKFQPATPISGCSTQNFISILVEGELETVKRFISFDVYFKDCQNNMNIKTVSLPLSRVEFNSYLNIPYNLSGIYNSILGTDNNNMYNSNFTFKAETIEKISNTRFTGDFNSIGPTIVKSIEKPKSINVSNEPGEENSMLDRAEINSNVSLSIYGGQIPVNGRWEWYQGEKMDKKIANGNKITLFVDGAEPYIFVSVIGISQDGLVRTDPVIRKVYIEVRESFFKEIDNLVYKEEFDKAMDKIKKLKESYGIEPTIDRKYQKIKELIDRKQKLEEEKKLNDILNGDFNLLYDFPRQTQEIKSSIYKIFDTKLFSKEIDDGKYTIDINVDYVRNERYYFKNNLNFGSQSLNLTNFIIKRLENVYFTSPNYKLNNKDYEVNARGNFKFDLVITSWKQNAKKRKGAWDISDTALMDKVNKSYITIPDGTYQLEIKQIRVDNNNYWLMNNKFIKSDDGPINVFNSIIVPHIGRNNVGLKGGLNITYSILSLAAISSISKLYSNYEYTKFKNAVDQTTLDKSYSKSNLANRIHLVTAGIGITIYTSNLFATYLRGRKNKVEKRNLNLPVIKDTIVLN